MGTDKHIEQVSAELKAVMHLIKQEFGDDYAKKNPDMVRFLLEKIQQHKYYELQTAMSSSSSTGTEVK